MYQLDIFEEMEGESKLLFTFPLQWRPPVQTYCLRSQSHPPFLRTLHHLIIYLILRPCTA